MVERIQQPNVTSENQPALTVAIVSESSMSHTSGVTNSVMHIADYLQRAGHRPTIICPQPAPDEINGVPVIQTPSVMLKGFNIGHATQRRFRHMYESIQPDVAHIAAPMGIPSSCLFLGKNAVRVAMAEDIPTVAVYQTDAVRIASHLGLGPASAIVETEVRRLHNNATINLVPSRSAMRDVIDWGVDALSLRMWGRGVDTDLFRADRRMSYEAALNRAMWAPNGEVIVGVVSRLEPEKSLHKLEILQDIPGIKVVITGSGTQEPTLKNLMPKATFTGKLTGNALANAYASFDIFAFPSTADTFAQVIQEAMASGVPVVAARRGGPKDLVDHGLNGFLYEPSDRKGVDSELRKHVMLLANDKAMRERMAMAAVESVQSKTWDSLSQQMIAYYREAIQIERQRRQSTLHENSHKPITRTVTVPQHI
jgi:phosphatidylinositol alpha 1,6-mannosyltransferase